MTAYGAACACGWTVGPIGKANRRHSPLAELWVDLRRWLHKQRCPL